MESLQDVEVGEAIETKHKKIGFLILVESYIM
jgi:hypothetical protein